jgi:hypothetical protein
MGIALRKSESDELMIPDPTKSDPGISKRRVLLLVGSLTFAGGAELDSDKGRESYFNGRK